MEFKTKFNELDHRSVFANRVLAIIYQKYGGDLNVSIAVADELFKDFETHVRNIYELIDDEIPLYRYYELMEYGADNWNYTDEEYQEEIKKATEACHLYYNKERWFI